MIDDDDDDDDDGDDDDDDDDDDAYQLEKLQTVRHFHVFNRHGCTCTVPVAG